VTGDSLKQATLSNASKISGRAIRVAGEKARNQGRVCVAEHREFQLNVSTTNPMGDFPSGMSLDDLLDHVCEAAGKKISGTSGDGMGAAEDDDTDAADAAALTAGSSTGAMMASSPVTGVDVDKVSDQDKRDVSLRGRQGPKFPGWIIYLLFGPSGSPTMRSNQLFPEDFAGSRKDQRKAKANTDAKEREATVDRGESAAEMEKRALVAQADEAAEMKGLDRELLALNSQLKSLESEMKSEMQIIPATESQCVPDDMRAEARTTYAELRKEAKELRSKLKDLAERKRAPPMAVESYLYSKRPKQKAATETSL